MNIDGVFNLIHYTKNIIQSMGTDTKMTGTTLTEDCTVNALYAIEAGADRTRYDFGYWRTLEMCS